MNTILPERPERLLTSEEVADWLRIKERTLRLWRDSGKGPRAQRVGAMIRYRQSDVQRWLDDQQRDQAS